MGGAHSVAIVLWLSGVAWLALTGPSLGRARLQVGRFEGSFERFQDAAPDSKRNATEAQKRWKQSVLQPIWFALISGTSFFGWASVRAGSSVELATNETILLLCGSLGFVAAAWLSNAFDAAPQPADSQLPASQQAASSAREEAGLSGFVLRFFLRRFGRAEKERDNALSSTRTEPLQPRPTIQDDLANARFTTVEQHAAVEAGIAFTGAATGAAQSDSQLLHSVFQVTRNFLTLVLPCAAAAAGIWHVAQWKTSALTVGMGAGPEIWISEMLVCFASLRYLLLSLHQNLAVSRTSRGMRLAIETLREEVSWRTQQLTTLHSVSADLNNTLNNEQVLNIALQRLMEAVRADAGAVWLVADFDQIAAEKSDPTRSFGNWNAELRRPKNSRDTSAASSTRTSFATRLNLADACDLVQAQSEPRRTKTIAANGAEQGEGTRDAVRDSIRRSKLFRDRSLRDSTSSNGSSANGSSANGSSANGVATNGNGRIGSGSKASQKQAKGKLDHLEALLGTIEGSGFYLGAPVEPQNTIVCSTDEIDGEGVLHRVSHTRDTYGASSNPARQTNDHNGHHNGKQTNGISPREASTASENDVWDGSVVSHRNWRLVRAAGYDTPTTNRTLEAMSRALEAGGIARCARLAASWYGTIGDVHLAPIRWNGEVIGVLSVTSCRRGFGGADRRLLEALAVEVSGALRNAYMYQQARRWAERDGVTNLFNHRAMQEKLGQEMLRAHQTGTELTVVMMDLDNFKFFNDTYGHPVGDGVLVTVAQCLRDCCRSTDILGRYGGDEFIVLLPSSNVQDAIEICRCIQKRIEQESYGQGGGEERRIPIGLSFGAAVYPHDGRTPLEILTVADANLYDAKRGGSPLAQINKNEDVLELRHLKESGVGGSFSVLDALVTAIDNKDHYTRRHSEDVTHWAVLMGRELGFSEETLRTVRISGLLHDVGKIAVPDAILRKPGRLSDDEFNILQQHPVFGALIVKDVPNLPEVLGGIRHHHERFDGKGYPDKLAGHEIPMLGRLLAVPDCFSAMTTNRPYRKALTWSEALSEIERGSGTQFDPQMAEAFLEVIARLIAERDKPAPLPSFNSNRSQNAVYETVDYPSAYAS
jgi:diguanylate cyclase (GGDEF)-like protein